jgi:beta-lactamase class A
MRVRAALLAGALLVSTASVGAAETPIEAEIARLAAPAGGVTGVAAWRLDGGGPRVLVNAQESFPMASTFKVAIAGAVLAAVDAGRLGFDQLLEVDGSDFVPSDAPGSTPIHPGIRLPLRQVLELMLMESYDTAANVLMRYAGGPDAVTRWVRSQGVTDMRIDRDTVALLADFHDFPRDQFTELYTSALNGNPALLATELQPNSNYDVDARDSATPAAMAELLTRIFGGKALGAASTKILVETMERCRTGENRLRGRLPAGTVVAHKTGTLGGSVNDVGVVTLPGDGGRLVIAVFVKKSDRPIVERERAIAEIARSVRDYYVLGY